MLTHQSSHGRQPPARRPLEGVGVTLVVLLSRRIAARHFRLALLVLRLERVSVCVNKRTVSAAAGASAGGAGHALSALANRIANVVYVEAPSGVGLSFSKDTSKYQNVTDEESSYDNFLFLQAFFKVFNSFAKNDFYITAESYGGHYGPTLAMQVLTRPNDFPMKGLLIGNPGINSDWYFNVNEYAFVTFCWSHGLIPAPAYFDAVEKCGWNEFYSLSSYWVRIQSYSLIRTGKISP